MPEQVLIRSVEELVDVDEAGDPRDVVAITYATAAVPPRTVFIDKGKDTPEERRRVIKEDLEAARAARSTPFQLP